MMLHWSDYQRQVLALVAEIGRAGPGTVRGYRELGNAGAAKDLLGAKTRELIVSLVFSTRVMDAYAAKSATAGS
jgi:hypothetical protein